MATLSAEEARWLREAEALKIWRPLGMVSAIDYMERVLGYAPRTAQDRLRVARALGGLPRLTDALAAGELAFTAVRELTRVATSATEEEWIAKAIGKNLRQIEVLVADHHLGDRPDDPKDPAARVHVVRLELSAQTFALFRQARQALDEEHGASLSEDQLIAALCACALEDSVASEPTGRARFQVAVTVCQRCAQGWQHGAGAKVAIDAAAVDRALCDAQHIGSLDGTAPERAYQDVSPSVARFVWHRDGGRCRTPGCRSARGLEVHHVVHRADGGSHEATNLVLLCSACHQAHHAGTLAITGSAARLDVARPRSAASVTAAAPAPLDIVPHTDATSTAAPAPAPLDIVPHTHPTSKSAPAPAPLDIVPHTDATPTAAPAPAPLESVPHTDATSNAAPAPAPLESLPHIDATAHAAPAPAPLDIVPHTNATPTAAPAPAPLESLPHIDAASHAAPAPAPLDAVRRGSAASTGSSGRGLPAQLGVARPSDSTPSVRTQAQSDGVRPENRGPRAVRPRAPIDDERPRHATLRHMKSRHVVPSASLANSGAHVGATADSTMRDPASMRADAEAALSQMGWKPALARAAVAAVSAERYATLEAVIIAALQRCPRSAR